MSKLDMEGHDPADSKQLADSLKSIVKLENKESTGIGARWQAKHAVLGTRPPNTSRETIQLDADTWIKKT